ncbi:MAG: FHA domain-containing protein [Planctomycetes bacterium]|nr:FHA domain-containing protein [Planctomycetota bacterium]
MSQWILRLTGPDGTSTEVEAVPGLVCGRSRKCELRVESPVVSGNQFDLVEEGGGIALRDLGSRNGTRLRDGRVLKGETLPLSESLEIVLGDHVITVVADEPAPETALDSVIAEATQIASAPSSESLPVADSGTVAASGTEFGALIPGSAKSDPPVMSEMTIAADFSRPSEEEIAREKAKSERVAREAEAARQKAEDARRKADEARAEAERQAHEPEPKAEEHHAVNVMTMEMVNTKLKGANDQAFLREARPRILICHPTLSDIVLVDSESFVIGSGRSSTTIAYKLDHRTVSREHAKIVARDGRFRLADLGSTNGVTVYTDNGGQRIDEWELADQTRFLIGGVPCLFLCDLDTNGQRRTREDFDRALDWLLAHHKVNRESARRAEERVQAHGGSIHHAAEILLTEGDVALDDWFRALSSGGVGPWSRNTIIGIAVGVLIFIAVLIWLLK